MNKNSYAVQPTINMNKNSYAVQPTINMNKNSELWTYLF